MKLDRSISIVERRNVKIRIREPALAAVKGSKNEKRERERKLIAEK